MKVIGKTKDGYLLEATAYEISRLSDGKATENRSGYGYDPVPIPLGTTFDVTKVIEHMHALTQKRDQAVAGVSTLIGLADLLKREIPILVAQPVEEPVAEVKP